MLKTKEIFKEMWEFEACETCLKDYRQLILR